jgi:hypothetical protein
LRFLLFFLVFGMAVLALAPAASAQGEEAYRKEFTYGFNINSNGGLLGGGTFKWTRYRNDQNYRYFGFEIVEVKHPKEARYASQVTSNAFVLGKSNYLFVLRPHVGLERILFRKAPDQGVQVSAVAAAGPSMGMLKPYLINYNYGRLGPNCEPLGQPDVRTEQYNPALHTDPSCRIEGNAGFANGLFDFKPQAGLHAQAGLSFEYGQNMEGVAGIEVGVLVEGFTKALVMMPNAKNYQTFQSVYMVLYYGKRR